MLGHGFPFVGYIWLLLAQYLLWAYGHVNHGDHEEKVQMLKAKWSVEDVIRDIEHIKEDMASIIELKKLDKLTQDEAIFYIIRMHDFDDNGGLDGIEIRVAAKHSLEHSKNHPDDVYDQIEHTIEEILKYDASNDGVVDYGEMKMLLKKERGENS